MKVHFFDRNIVRRYASIISWFSVVVSIIAIIIPFPETWSRKTALIVLLSCLGLVYICTWLWANKLKKVKIAIRNTKIVVKEGDIFAEDTKKVIPFNEYFDTHVGDGIIDEKSLNGIYIKKKANRSPSDLYNDIILNLQEVRRKTPLSVDSERKNGGKIRFELGTLYDDGNDYFLLAYSRFDDQNRAYLSQNDLLRCYINMWSEIDVLRGINSISMPVLGGSGLVRFSKDPSPQQLIELILWSFRVSGINLSRNCTLNIIVHKGMLEDINFLKLLSYSD